MKTSSNIVCILIILCSLSVRSQNVLLERLVNSVKTECRLNIHGMKMNYPNLDSRIEEKCNYANIYLQAQLTGLVLSDSSNFYEEMCKKVKQLEQRTVTDHRDSIMWLNETEKALLVVCLLQPSRSDTAFNKVVKLWCGVKEEGFIITDKQTVYDCRAWIYELLDKRFHTQTNVFGTQQLNYVYRKAIGLLEKDFKGIKQERKNMSAVVSLMKEAKRDSLVYKAYLQKATALELTYHMKERTDSMHTFLVELYTEALRLAPDGYDTNYNLYRFYYNEGASIMQSMKEEDKDLEEKQAKAKRYFKKSLVYAKKIGK